MNVKDQRMPLMFCDYNYKRCLEEDKKDLTLRILMILRTTNPNRRLPTSVQSDSIELWLPTRSKAMTHRNTPSWPGPTPSKLRECCPGPKESNCSNEQSNASLTPTRSGTCTSLSSLIFAQRGLFSQRNGESSMRSSMKL